ncbi:hypothetical protein BAE44_0023098 [Dichanthelium oligosanthes]|uniref:Epidermal patterning factor-like protein n=1 Tax=Dichanthelium oligosanthes TaxID=888268 RepID=A0A1E5USM9_9POAL|nr:hypothetical protein BAE44_0023098 [Dichanthelium oligosanthes]
MGHRVFFLLSLVLLLISSTAHATGHAQAAAITQQGMGGVESMMRTIAGSRPPSCAGMCWWCGGRRCVAVQVPITPQDKQATSHGRPRRGGASASAKRQQPSSYDDHSNYKPLSWRCRCGGGAVGLNP